MFYIEKDNAIIDVLSFSPDVEDLATRGENLVETDDELQLGFIKDGDDWVAPSVDLDSAKAAMKAGMLVEADQMVSSFKDGYSETEQQSWPEQKTQAEAFLAGDKTAEECPLLMGISGNDETLVQPLAQKIVANAALFSAVVAGLIRVRSAGEAMIDAAADLEALEALPDQIRALANAALQEVVGEGP